MNCTIIIQARMGSKRLPAKVLAPLGHSTVLEFLVHRLLRVFPKQQLILATTTNLEDQVLLEVAEKLGIKAIAGDENDVLSRFGQASRLATTSYIARITGDCPLVIPETIKEMAEFAEANVLDYVCTSEKFAEGLDIEIVSLQALATMQNSASKKSEREHVTQYIYNHPSEFRWALWLNDRDDSTIRITVDESNDLRVVQAIVDYYQQKEITLDDIRCFHSQFPAIVAENANIVRNEGLLKSLANDS